MHFFHTCNDREYSLFHRCAIYTPYPVYIAIAAQNAFALLYLSSEILYVLKGFAQMSPSPLSISRFPSQKLVPPSSILPMLLSLDFFCIIFCIIYCVTISSIYIFFSKLWYLRYLRVGIRKYLYFVSHRVPRNIKSSVTMSWIEQWKCWR